MRTRFNLAEELSAKNAVPFAPVSGAFIFKDETPAHQFVTVVARLLESGHYVALASRDFFDERLAVAVLALVTKRASDLSVDRPLVLLDGFKCSQYSFDAVAVLSPDAARQFEHDNQALNERAFVAFPIHRCELSGDESIEVLDLIRHELLPSLDWKRSPCPKVTMSYRNKKNKASSRPRLVKLATVLFEIGELHEGEGSWIELENYAGRRCRVEWSQGHYTAEFPEQEATSLGKIDLINCVTRFLTGR